MLGNLVASLVLHARCILAGLRHPPQHFAPDKYATEAPFLSDRWPAR
jgi:hypothetical protein